MPRNDRKGTQELFDFALSHVPATGEIEYKDLYAAIQASDNPQAVSMLPELKKRGVVSARIEVIDGVVTHAYRRSETE